MYRWVLQMPASSFLTHMYNHSKLSKSPYFSIPSDQIKIIEDPLQFFLELKRGVDRSSFRIGLSSLYIGTGPLQNYLLTCIEKRMTKIPSLQTTMLFDYNRSTRGIPSPQTQLQSIKMSIPRIKVGLLKHSLSQISGVHHQKAYIFDDSVMIGGANLSHNYFLNRKDRYMMINNAPSLSDYLYEFMEIVADNCDIDGEQDPNLRKAEIQIHQKVKESHGAADPNVAVHPHAPTILRHHLTTGPILSPDRERETGGNQQEDSTDPYQVTNNKNDAIAQSIGGAIVVKKVVSSEEYNTIKQEIRQNLFNIEEQSRVGNELMQLDIIEEREIEQKGQRIYLFPIMTFPHLNHNQPSLLKTILQQAHLLSLPIRLSSGYLNLSSYLRSTLLQQPQNVSILCSSPQANSFFKAQHLKQYIPFLYRCFEYDVLTQHPNTTLKEYNNHEWSFHAKGIWIKEHDKSYVTVVGSSNHNQRSALKDTELQMYIYSSCEVFNRRLDKEYEGMDKHCQTITVEEIQKDSVVRCNWFWRIISKALRKYL